MAFLGIRVPHEAARLLHAIDIPGSKTDSGQLHITLLYIGKDTPIKDIAKAMVATFNVAENTCPFLVKTNHINYFDVPRGEEYPIIAPISSLKLHELNKNLKQAFDKMNIDYNKKYKEYNPHITLAFNDEPIKKTKIEQIEWSIQELVLWGGEDGDDRIFITFPLALKKNAEIYDMCCGK